MAQRATPSSRKPFLCPLLLSLLAGVLLGLAFPPVDWKWLAWIGLVPLLWALHGSHEQPARHVFLLGCAAGLPFFLMTLHPLVSVATWMGWASGTAQQLAARVSQQRGFMHEVCL